MAISLWPGLGMTAVLDEEGGTVPAAGISISSLTPYYEALVVRGHLVTYDPLDADSSPATVTTQPTLFASTTTALALTEGGTDTQIALASGHTTAGDGGGGLFTWHAGDSTTADGATILGTGSGRWKRVYSAPVSPEWFGAVGDGVTDDTVAFQAALDSLVPVRCKRGATYLVSRQASYDGTRWYCLTWASYMRLDLNGATIKVADSQGYASAIYASGTVNEAVMENGYIDGNETNQTYVSGITPTVYMHGSHYDCKWLNLTVKNGHYTAFYVSGGARCHIDNLTVRGCLGVGVNLRTSSDWTIGSVDAYDCRYLEGAPGNGFVADVSESTIGEIYADNCAYGIKFQGASKNLTIGSIVAADGSGTSKADAVIVAQNGEKMVKFQGTDDTTFVSNVSVGSITIKDAPGIGLYCFKAQNITIGSVALSNCGWLQDDDFLSADAGFIDSEVSIASMTCRDTNQTAVSLDVTTTAWPVRIGKLRINTSKANKSKTIKNDLGQLVIDDLHVYRRANTADPVIYASSASPNYTRVRDAFLDIDVDNVLAAGTPLFQSYTGAPVANEILLDRVEFATKAVTELVTLTVSTTSTAVANKGITSSTTVFGAIGLTVIAQNASARTLSPDGSLPYAVTTTGFTLHHPTAAGGEKYLVISGGYSAPYEGP